MNQGTGDPIKLTRDCNVVAVPAGHIVTLAEGTEVVITQSLGGTYTLLVPSYGGLFRLGDRDADAIGMQGSSGDAGATKPPLRGEELEREIWQILRTCYDPEIPVNIVDLGLIYGMQISELPSGGSRVEVKMTLTAQGCGMGASIAGDARYKLMNLPGVEEADVQVVWDPPWGPDRISSEGKALLGIH